MQTFMLTLDRFIRRHRRAVLAAWLIALVAAVPFAMRQSQNLTGGGEAGLVPAAPRTASAGPAAAGRFLRHYGEMVAAMLVGMIALGVPAGMALNAFGSSSSELSNNAPALMLLGMAISMTAPMAAWMRHRGHGWRASLEMSAAMFVPTIAAIGLLAAGVVESVDSVLLAEHVVMLVAMLMAMLLRPSEYTHARGPAVA